MFNGYEAQVGQLWRRWAGMDLKKFYMRLIQARSAPPARRATGAGAAASGRQAHLVLRGAAACGVLVVAAATNQLGANPAKALIRSTGDWALRAVPWCLA